MRETLRLWVQGNDEMHYDRNVYRPPSEATSLLLQVTVGCSHNECTFCNMFSGSCFRVSPWEEVESDLREAARTGPHTTRVFLLNGNAFVLSYERLRNIVTAIRAYLPQCETICMYASIPNIQDKTVAQLKELRALGVNELYIGLESGYDPALAFVKKGYTAQEAVEMLQKLDEAGVDYYSIVLTGIAGAHNGVTNAMATAEVLNQVRSAAVFPMSLVVIPGTPIHRQVQQGEFTEATELERLLEVKTLLERLELKRPTMFSSQHNTNTMPLGGMLPKDRAKFIAALDKTLRTADSAALDKAFRRSSRRI